MKPSLTEKNLFRGQEITTVNVEITNELRDQLIQAHDAQIKEGVSSLTFEQFVGGFTNLGYNWSLYSNLKKIFNK
jgi:hypothetical protein